MNETEKICSNMSESDDSSSDSSAENEIAVELSNKIQELQEELHNNPWNYDKHVEMIDLTRKIGDLNALRSARFRMCELFPLKKDLWLSWIDDEMNLAITVKEKEKMLNLFVLALKDYLSMEIWQKFLKFSIENVKDKGIAKVRNIFEVAIKAVGCHVAEGIIIWENYREFEVAVLQGYQLYPNCSLSLIDEQKSRILELFRRQFALPLMGMEGTLDEYKQFAMDSVDEEFVRQHQRSLNDLQMRLYYEKLLAEGPDLEKYDRYIKFEFNCKRSDLIRCLFERAIADFPQQVHLWLQLTDYLVKNPFSKRMCNQTFERALRNCSWSSELWISYGLSMERFRESDKVVKEIYNRALNSGLQTTYDYCKVWASYIHFLRRKALLLQETNATGKEVADAFDELRTALEIAINQLYEHFGQEADPSCYFERYWALIEAKYCRNMGRAREIWYDNILAIGNVTKSSFWLEFFELEMRYGTERNCRKILYKAIDSAMDNTELLCDTLINFEEQNGTLDSLDIAKEKIIDVRKRQEMKVRGKGRKGTTEEHEELPKKKKKPADNADVQPVNDSKYSSAKKTRNKQNRIPQAVMGKSTEMDLSFTDPKINIIKSHAVFISNLSYQIDETKAKDVFSKVGDIKSISIAKTGKNCSKGFGHIEFFSSESAKKALLLDTTEIDGRPVYVSEYISKECQSAAKGFKYPTSLEKNKLFLSQLPRSVGQETLTKIYTEFGGIKDVRIVKYRNGHSKGLAYVEFENEASAANALLKTDGMVIDGQKISVAISNPPERKPPSTAHTLVPSLGSGGSKNIVHGKRTLDINLIPRSVNKDDVNSQPPAKKLSNDDFRKIFLK